jgi:hypothetical protein
MKPLLAMLFVLLLGSPCFAQNSNTFKPVSSGFQTDVDGDAKPDRLFYEIRAWETEYEGLFRIISSEGKVLWEHQYLMMKRDLVNWLGVVGNISTEDWVRGFCSNKYGYGAEVKRIKLKSSDLDDEQIAYAAELVEISPAKLKGEILSQKENRVVLYRAEWREDLMSLVYVPSLKRFVCYHRGY